MTLKIADLRRLKPSKKVVSYEGLELTLCVKNEPNFNRVLFRTMKALEVEKQETEKQETEKQEVEKQETEKQEVESISDVNSLRQDNNKIHPLEALLFFIGEYAISDWNVTDSSDKPVAISGDAFNLVMEHVPDLGKFIPLLVSEFSELVSGFYGEVEEVKKKPTKPLNGKK